ncbi:MobH family relaxase [Photobacterium leiognathi]|uniref:MobH family relaxase n=1 Tax=Photobacterium leiognathi TaxID=553611 RepID=UPI002981EDED|nr:MobH family relaxase [Photobacterium leiognathi]
MLFNRKKPKTDAKEPPKNTNEKRAVIDPKISNDKGFFTACSSEQLLDIHSHVISVIDSNTRLSKMHFDMYYRKTIANYAALVQAFPASEYHHHSYPTGLIEHSLDVARAAVVYARKYLYTETGVESEMEEMLDIFTYACFTAALLHDAGKVVTDLDVVYYNDKNQICAWMPFGESQLKEGTLYKWRYNSVRNKLAHESAAPTLVQTIVPIEGIYWIRSRTPRLWQEWLHTIAGRNKFGGDVGKVIEHCDSYSVQKSMSGNSSKDGQHANTRHTLSERFVIAFRQLIESGSLPLNRKGAGAWVKDGFVYFVSQRAVEAAIPLVKSAGGTGIPTNDVTIFSLLCDGGVALRHEETNDVVHSMKITLHDDDWSGDLTFLKVALDTIDPHGSLGLVEGNITLTDNTSESGFNAKRDAKNSPNNDNDSNDQSTSNQTQPDNYQSLTSDLMSDAFSSLDSSEAKPDVQIDITNTTSSAMASDLDKMFGEMGQRKPRKEIVNSKNKPITETVSDDQDLASLLGGDNKPSESAPASAPVTETASDDLNFDSILGGDSEPSEPAPASAPVSETASDDLVFDSLLSGDSKPSEPAPASAPVTETASDDLNFDSILGVDSEPCEPALASAPVTETASDDLVFDSLLFGDSQPSEPAPISVPVTETANEDLDFDSLLGGDNKPSEPAPAVTQTKETVNGGQDDHSALSKDKNASNPKKKVEPGQTDQVTKQKPTSLNDTGLDEINALFVNNDKATTEMNISDTNTSTEIEDLFLADANSRQRNISERTNYIEQSKALVEWIDNGIAGGTIRYNKLSSKSNYCYNTKNGWFVCLWSAIAKFNEQNPDNQIKIDRTERIISEMQNARLLHLDNKSNANREAVLSIVDRKNVTLRGVYFKRDSLKNASCKDKYVNAAQFTIMP